MLTRLSSHAECRALVDRAALVVCLSSTSTVLRVGNVVRPIRACEKSVNSAKNVAGNFDNWPGGASKRVRLVVRPRTCPIATQPPAPPGGETRVVVFTLKETEETIASYHSAVKESE